ncbi:unnamed protein product, partial [Symbiodinium microadriaticum]
VQVSGTGTTRESIVQNEVVLKPALQHLGMRPSVQTCMLHIKAFFDMMQLSIPAAHVYTQGWALRRMISMLNLIVRRGHTPREAAIVRLMESVGLTITPNAEADDGTSTRASSEDEGCSEHEESEELSDDEDVVSQISTFLIAKFERLQRRFPCFRSRLARLAKGFRFAQESSSRAPASVVPPGAISTSAVVPKSPAVETTAAADTHPKMSPAVETNNAAVDTHPKLNPAVETPAAADTHPKMSPAVETNSAAVDTHPKMSPAVETTSAAVNRHPKMSPAVETAAADTHPKMSPAVETNGSAAVDTPPKMSPAVETSAAAGTHPKMSPAVEPSPAESSPTYEMSPVSMVASSAGSNPVVKTTPNKTVISRDPVAQQQQLIDQLQKLTELLELKKKLKELQEAQSACPHPGCLDNVDTQPVDLDAVVAGFPSAVLAAKGVSDRSSTDATERVEATVPPKPRGIHRGTVIEEIEVLAERPCGPFRSPPVAVPMPEPVPAIPMPEPAVPANPMPEPVPAAKPVSAALSLKRLFAKNMEEKRAAKRARDQGEGKVPDQAELKAEEPIMQPPVPTPVRSKTAAAPKVFGSDEEIARALAEFDDDSEDDRATENYSLQFEEGEATSDEEEASLVEQAEVASVSLSIRGTSDGEERAPICDAGDDDGVAAEKAEPAEASGSPEEEIAKTFGRPPAWKPGFTEFLSPEDQKSLSRGRKPCKGKGKRKSRAKRSADADAEPPKPCKRARKPSKKPASDPESTDSLPSASSKKPTKRTRSSPSAPKSARRSILKKAGRYVSEDSSPSAAKRGGKSSKKPVATVCPDAAEAPRPKAKPTKKPAAKAKAKSEAKANSRDPSYRAPCTLEAEYKARMSRKSCAYHKALKQARAKGKSEAEMKALARAAA